MNGSLVLLNMTKSSPSIMGANTGPRIPIPERSVHSTACTDAIANRSVAVTNKVFTFTKDLLMLFLFYVFSPHT